jgi:cell division protein FtsB
MYSIPTLVLLGLAAFFLTRGAIRVLEKERESAELTRNLEEKAAVLSSREAELGREISRLKTEEGIKDEIKERFNVTEDGEYVAVIVDEKYQATSTPPARPPWYKRFWNAIIRNN